MAGTYSPAQLLDTFITCVADDVAPLTARRIAEGRGKVFGAAILRKSDLSLVIVECNVDAECPLWHGETYCIKCFYELPQAQRPPSKDCFFLTTHEPCSLCLSAIAWSGFDNFYYLFSHAESRDEFDDPFDMAVMQALFGAPASPSAHGDSDGDARGRQPGGPLYNRKNRFLEATSFATLLEGVEDEARRARFAERLADLRRTYRRLIEAQRAQGAGFVLA